MVVRLLVELVSYFMRSDAKKSSGRKSTNISRAVCLLAVLSLLAATETARAQTLPAVSQFNGNLSYEGGDMDSDTGNNFNGSLTVPVGHSFGFQADALYSRISDLDFYGGAGHFFWRDPDIGLVGLAGGYIYRNGVDTFQIGTEGQYYIGPVTLGFFGGAGSINYDNPAPFIDTHPTQFVGRLSADYYPVRDLRLTASYTTAFRESLYQAALEYQTPVRGLALTGGVAYGDYGFHQWLVGIRYYFGAKKSLRDRDRQDDAPGIPQQILQTLGLYGAEFNHKEAQYLAAQGDGNSGSGVFGVSTQSGSSGDYSGNLGVVTIEYFPPPLQPITLTP
jgi:hypothetical protein